MSVPPEYQYADYLTIVTARSARHMSALTEYVLKLYKKKMGSTDRVPTIEGKGSQDWMALDIGNIILHVFEQSAREYYDLETLWSVGKEYDSKSNSDDVSIKTIKDYSSMLANLVPDEK